MIDSAIVQQIFESAVIEDVVGDYVSLKKRGANLLGLCPFHNEKTPSFNVSPSKGIYKCFGCGKGGNAVNFVMEHEHLNYPEALRHLAKRYNIEIQEKELSPEELAASTERESLLIINESANTFFHEQLLKGEEGKRIGLSYFRERGMDGKTIAHFSLGYCPEGPSDSFTKHALGKGYKEEYLKNTGLIKEGRNGLYDFFHGRVMFPIRSVSGRVLGFGGRTLRSDKSIAKYFNSPESVAYDKSKVLYGLFESKSAIAKLDMCYIVEGYMDVISMHQAGVENAVASSGTSLTSGQVRLLRRYTPNATLLYDSDAAGVKATVRGMEILLEEGMKVRVVSLPEGEDPDSLSQSIGGEAFHSYLKEQSKDAFEFIVDRGLAEAGQDPIKRGQAIQEAIRILSLLPDVIELNLKSKAFADRLGIDEKALSHQLREATRRRKQQKVKQQEIDARRASREEAPPLSADDAPPSMDDSSGLSDIPEAAAFLETVDTEQQERDIIRILLKYGQETLHVPLEKENDKDEQKYEELLLQQYVLEELCDDREIQFNHPVYGRMWALFQAAYAEERQLSTEVFLRHPDPHINSAAAGMMTDAHRLHNWERHDLTPVGEEKKLFYAVEGALNQLRSRIIKRMIKEAQASLRSVEHDQEKMMATLQRIQVLNRMKARISAPFGTVILDR